MYRVLLKLLCKESGYEEGIVTGFLADVHIYENHVEQCKLQLSREPYDLPELDINNFESIFEWKYTDLDLKSYQSYPSIKAPIAV